MRILFVSNLFPDTTEPYRGQDNAEVLRRLVARGHEVRVIAPRAVLFPRRLLSRGSGRTATDAVATLQPEYPRWRHVPRIGGPVNHLLLRRVLRSRVKALVEAWKPDVALCAWAYPDAVAAAPLFADADLPWVGIVQGTDVHGYLASPVRRRLIPPALSRAHAVICRSGDLARRLREAGVPADRLVPVVNGVDTALFAPGDRMATRRHLEFKGPGPWLLYIGNFYGVKNPVLAVEALARLRGRAGYRDARLILVGGGPLEPEIRARAEALGIADALHFAGRHRSEGVAGYLRAADLLVIPSWNEGLPNVLLESLASGVPVVSTRVGGIAEVLRDGVDGRLVPPGDPGALAAAMGDVLEAPPSPASLVSYASGFRWDKAVARYEEILAAAAGSHHPPA